MASFIRLIDEGLRSLIFTKFQNVLGIGNYTQDTAFVPKDIAFRKVMESRSGNVYTEFFNLWRTGIKRAFNRHTPGFALQGMYPFYLDDTTKRDGRNVKAIAVDLSYDLCLWSRDLSKLVDSVDLYTFWMYNDPALRMSFDSKAPLEFKLTFGDITDGSPVEQAYDKGIYFVYTMPIVVEGFIFQEFSSKVIKKIIVSIYDYELGIDKAVLLDQFNIV